MATRPKGFSLVRMLAVCVLAGVFMASVGAFGSYEAQPPIRFAYWMTLMPLGGLIALGSVMLLNHVRWLEARPIAFSLALALCVASAMTIVVSQFTPLVFGGRSPGLSWSTFWMSLIVSGTMTMLGEVLESGRSWRDRSWAHGAPDPIGSSGDGQMQAPGSPDQPSGPGTQAARTSADPFALLRERLPDKIRPGAILALEAQDHYVRVHTSLGTDLILMRLSDAIALLPEQAGLRLHRSWWVCRALLKQSVRVDGRLVVPLPAGISAPVARARVQDVRAAGVEA